MRNYGPWQHSSTRTVQVGTPAPCKAVSTLLTILLTVLVLAGSSPRAEASGQLSASPTALSFGSVVVGKTSTISLSVKNTGNASVYISSGAVAGTGFSLTGVSLPMTLATGATITVQVTFAPKQTGSVTGKISAISNASNSSFTVVLSGTGITQPTGYVSATPMAGQFGNVPVGTRNTQTIQLKNTGTQSLSISKVTASGTGYSVSGVTTPLSLAPGATAQVTAAFSPSTVGSLTGTVVVQSNASDSQVSISLSGSGVASARQLSIAPTSIAFGNVGVNTATTREVTLKNAGNSNITVSSTTVNGTGLSLTGVGSGTTITPGQSAILIANFAPKATGAISGTITIASNASNGTSLTVPVTADGVVAAHVANLQWQASSSSGVLGYYVYRSNSSGGPYTKLVGSAIAGTGYADNNVSAGTQYYYVVTAVNNAGQESIYSNQVAVKVP